MPEEVRYEPVYQVYVPYEGWGDCDTKGEYDASSAEDKRVLYRKVVRFVNEN